MTIDIFDVLQLLAHQVVWSDQDGGWGLRRVWVECWFQADETKTRLKFKLVTNWSGLN